MIADCEIESPWAFQSAIHTIINQQLAQAANRYNFGLRRRRALVITETELKLMAAAAKMGLSSRPKKG